MRRKQIVIDTSMTRNNPDLSSGLADILAQVQALSHELIASVQFPDLSSSLQDLRREVLKSTEAVLQSHFQTSEMLQSLTSSFQNLAQEVFSSFHFDLSNLISPALENFIESFRELPEQTQTALLTLGNHGWFFDLEMPMSSLWALEAALNEGNIAEAEAALADYYRENLDIIENRLCSKFPHRAKIIKAAFSAHRRGEYELSIPIFLAQTDGICYEVINHYYFIRVRGERKPSTAIYVDSVASNAFRQALLAPLSQPLPISASQKERGDTFNELNRHQVMHGESLDYGTDINSLKSISLITYVSHVLKLDNADVEI